MTAVGDPSGGGLVAAAVAVVVDVAADKESAGDGVAVAVAVAVVDKDLIGGGAVVVGGGVVVIDIVAAAADALHVLRVGQGVPAQPVQSEPWSAAAFNVEGVWRWW